MLKKEMLSYFVLFIIYRFVLDFIYIFYINPIYDYAGMHMNGNIYFYIASWIIFIGFLPLLYINIRKPNFTGLAIYLLSIISFTPMTTLIGLYGVDVNFVILITVYWFLLFSLAYIIKPIKIPFFKGKKSLMYSLSLWLFVSSIIVIYISGKYTSFRLHFDLVNVYDIRMDERSFKISSLLIYMHNATSSILPILFIYFLYLKKTKYAIFTSFIIFLNFGIGGHKAIIFIVFLAVLAYYFFSYKRNKLLIEGMIIVSFLSLLEMIFLKSGIFLTIFINRLLFIPAKLNISFYSFFQNHELLYFRQGPLRLLGFSSPYSKSINFIIGELESGNCEVRANNGLFSDAYMNMGIIGVVLFPFIVVVILKVLEYCSKGINYNIIFLPVYITVSTLYSTTFTTALLNNGLILLIIFLLSISNKNNDALNIRK